MKEFFTIQLKHKIFKDIKEEVFVFHDISKFCYYSEYFHLRQEYWDVKISTNTKNINRYLEFLNTDITRRYLEMESFFETISDIDSYYDLNKEKLPFSVLDYYHQIFGENFFTNYNIEKDSLSFIEINNKNIEFENIQILKNLLVELDSTFKNNMEFKLFINPYLISFDEYIEIINIFSPNFNVPSYVNNSLDLFLFFNALEDLGTLMLD